MTIDDVLEIIKNENLKSYNMDESESLKENQIVLRVVNDEWHVFVTSEKAGLVTGSLCTYKNENDALENFLGRIRWMDKRTII